MATCAYDPADEIYSESLDYLLDLPRTEVISVDGKIVKHNTNQRREAQRIINRAAREGNRIQISAWDSDSGLVIPFASNPGHEPGIEATYFKEQMEKHHSKSFVDELIRLTPGNIHVKNLDYFMIVEYKEGEK